MSKPNHDISIEDLIHQFRCEIDSAVDLLHEASSLSRQLSGCSVSELGRELERVSGLLEESDIKLKKASTQIQTGCEQWGDSSFSSSVSLETRVSDPYHCPSAIELAMLIVQNEEPSGQVTDQQSLRLVEGDSTKLTDNLISAGISKPGRGYQAHHIIPSAVANKSELMLNAIVIAGFDIDCAENGIFLPPNIFNDDLLPPHRGNHPRYSNYAEDVLKHKWEELKDSSSQTNKVALMSAVSDTITHLKTIIKTQGEFLHRTINDL